MIFARYKGAAGRGFTDGKVYLAKPEVNGGETVGFALIEIEDDDGNRVRVNPEKEDFEYLEEVYAVVATPFEDLDAGEVVVLDGATDDGEFLRVQGIGYRKAVGLIVLDRTNVFPGLSLMEASSGNWLRVRTVDECLWIAIEGQGDSRSPEEFRFAVAGGDILTEPIVKCVDADGEPRLTEGRRYLLHSCDSDDLWTVEADDGAEARFMASRFEMGK